MIRKVAIASVCWLVFIVAAKVGFAICDHSGASGSVGACHTPTALQSTCASRAEKDCASTAIFPVEIKEDFPTGCTTQANKNCNEPLRDCWQVVDCEWTTSCTIKMGTGKGWKQVPKRESVDCEKKS